ncbi:hypothetical protein TraAM80_04745 [Trypanosoma rangeli]|uniref:F-box domain-containing protein n=1 Tax=Trypanosoma rangeli TaxID=5698 RepID=A0A3R7KC63_TRYRA|nr:uncharacterized protein TraAM80_04745 [Trypanosoma rangeli]RNF05173.1 hypothetical protein TraAM80_04745 [Trypanosoma rangeli]|eukprot:RNF05173.1 hypothetical protein TraAM80_04745 [Trypanosoma rangeli]
MGGVSTPSSTDSGSVCGATAAAEASATDGSQGGRCVCSCHSESGRDERQARGPVVCRTSQSLTLYTASFNCGVSDVIHVEAGHACHAAAPSHMCHCSVDNLPVSVLDVVFTFLQTEGLCTVLGVSHSFYRAVSESDRTAWRAACLSLWRGKQGLAGVADMWAATEESCRREELEVIALQQQMLIDAHTSDNAAATMLEWTMLQGGEAKSEARDKKIWKRAHHNPQQLPPPCWTGRACKSEPASITTIASDSDSIVTGVRSASQQLWSRVPLPSTPTYKAIMSMTNSPQLPASLISPVRRRSVLPMSEVADATNKPAAHTTKLYWWQLGPDERQRHLYRIQQGARRLQLQSQQMQQSNRLPRRDEEGSQLLDEDNDEVSTTITTTTSRTCKAEPMTTPRRQGFCAESLALPPRRESGSTNSGPPLPLALPSACVLTADRRRLQRSFERETGDASVEDAEDSVGDLGDIDDYDDYEAAKKRDSNPYQEFEEEMALTHSLSVLQYAQQKALHRASSVGRLRQEGNDVDDDEEDLQLPVSWKFAYYTSLRDARRQWLTKQELVEATWYVCFRATGKTHPATFAADSTLIIHPAVHAPAGTNIPTSPGGNGGSGAAISPFLYQLMRGGTELVVHNFPPLKVHRRSVLPSAAATNKVGDATSSTTTAATPVPPQPANAGGSASNEGAAERAFLAEPDATLRRLMPKEEEDIYAGGEDAGDVETPAVTRPAQNGVPSADWGWVMQNFFVKIFSVGIPVPSYIHQLRRTCAPRPP